MAKLDRVVQIVDDAIGYIPEDHYPGSWVDRYCHKARHARAYIDHFELKFEGGRPKWVYRCQNWYHRYDYGFKEQVSNINTTGCMKVPAQSDVSVKEVNHPTHSNNIVPPSSSVRKEEGGAGDNTQSLTNAYRASLAEWKELEKNRCR